MSEKNTLVTYRVVSEFAGDKLVEKKPILEAAKEIFGLVKEKAMQCAVKGTFITFNTVEELTTKLEDAAIGGLRIKVFDEVFGG